MKSLFLALLMVLALPHGAWAASYVVDQENSQIAFSGTHAGDEFSGVFESWSAEIVFDPANLAASSANVTFDTTTAATGNKMYDGTLPQADWFDVKNHPQATFTSSSITAIEGGYRMDGTLTLKDQSHPVAFDFTLSEAEGVTKVQAAFDIDRLLFNIGVKSDPKAEWVSQMIGLTLDLTATKE